MTLRRLILVLCVATQVWAQSNTPQANEVRVRLYAVHPPNKLTLISLTNSFNSSAAITPEDENVTPPNV